MLILHNTSAHPSFYCFYYHVRISSSTHHSFPLQLAAITLVLHICRSSLEKNLSLTFIHILLKLHIDETEVS